MSGLCRGCTSANRWAGYDEATRRRINAEAAAGLRRGAAARVTARFRQVCRDLGLEASVPLLRLYNQARTDGYHAGYGRGWDRGRRA